MLYIRLLVTLSRNIIANPTQYTDGVCKKKKIIFVTIYTRASYPHSKNVSPCKIYNVSLIAIKSNIIACTNDMAKKLFDDIIRATYKYCGANMLMNIKAHFFLYKIEKDGIRYRLRLMV